MASRWAPGSRGRSSGRRGSSWRLTASCGRTRTGPVTASVLPTTGRWRRRSTWTASSCAWGWDGWRCAPCWRSSGLQGAHLVVAGITLPNPGSVALHEALGFARVGGFEAIGWKHGRWHGVDWFELELGPRDGRTRAAGPAAAAGRDAEARGGAGGLRSRTTPEGDRLRAGDRAQLVRVDGANGDAIAQPGLLDDDARRDAARERRRRRPHPRPRGRRSATRPVSPRARPPWPGRRPASMGRAARRPRRGSPRTDPTRAAAPGATRPRRRRARAAARSPTTRSCAGRARPAGRSRCRPGPSRARRPAAPSAWRRRQSGPASCPRRTVPAVPASGRPRGPCPPPSPMPRPGWRRPGPPRPSRAASRSVGPRRSASRPHTASPIAGPRCRGSTSARQALQR